MSFLWESVKQVSQMAGAAALLAGQKTKIRGEVMLTEREIKTRQQLFGVELYDYVAPLAKSPDFFAANDQMTDTIRGPFLGAQREIAALMIKRCKLKEELAQAEVTRRAAFPQPATTFGEQVLNTGKATAFTAHEVKIKTEIGMVDSAIRSHKEDFGEAMFITFVKLEDEQGWLPTVRDIRSMYDKARQDVDKLKAKIAAKENELQTMGTENDVAARNFTTSVPATTLAPSTTATTAPSPLQAQPVAPVQQVPPPVTATFGTFPASYAPPAPAPAPASSNSLFGSVGDSANYRPPAADALNPCSPSLTRTVATPAEPVSGLFLGLDGSGSSSHSAASSSRGGVGGTGQRRQQQQPQQQLSSASSSLPHDPFSFVNGAPSAPPITPAVQQDPFGFTPQPQQTSMPYDPFAFTQPSLQPQSQQPFSSSASASSSLPYDPFSNKTSSTTTTNYNDPFADLVGR